MRKNEVGKGQQVTRRQFLKDTGLIVGGAAISSIGLTSGCSSGETSTTSSQINTTTTNTTPTTNPATTTSSTSTNTTTTTVTTLPPAEGFVYKTPLDLPPEMDIPGCTTSTATDRKYVIEHMWIKMVAQGIVAIGITEKMSELTDYISDISLPQVGTTVNKGDYLMYITAAKMNVEFPAPVSGTVLQRNNDIFIDLVAMVNTDPYVKGWLMTIQLSHPEEWDELLTPQEYTDLNAKEL